MLYGLQDYFAVWMLSVHHYGIPNLEASTILQHNISLAQLKKEVKQSFYANEMNNPKANRFFLTLKSL